MKIALFGATGGTGLEFLRQSENYNFDITAVVRSPEKLGNEFPNLKIIKASIDDAQVLKEHVKNFDVVISLVGIPGILQARKPNALYERTANALVKLANENHIKRLITITSGGVIESPGEPWFFKYLLKPIFLNKMYDDMRIMEQIMTTSNIDVTIVRPPYLTNGKLTKKYRVTDQGWFEDDKDLSRADLAHFLLENANNLSMANQTIGISY